MTLPIPNAMTAPAGAKLVFRPQDATLDAESGLSLPGTIVHREFLGASVRYGVRIGESEISVDTPFRSGAALREPGRPVTVTVSPESVHFLSA